jgi:hypothetical protein
VVKKGKGVQDFKRITEQTKRFRSLVCMKVS